MTLTFLLDTSVLTRLGRQDVRKVVEPLAATGRLGRPRICDLEIGVSARNVSEWDRLLEALDTAVLHYDADFDLIASVTGQRCTWVVPSGSVQ